MIYIEEKIHIIFMKIFMDKIFKSRQNLRQYITLSHHRKKCEFVVFTARH